MVKIRDTPTGGGVTSSALATHGATRPRFGEKKDLSLGCESCGGEIAQHAGRGRPRKFCKVCRPTESRRKTEAQRLADNAARRVKYRAANPPAVRSCLECGATIIGRPDRKVCSRKCKDSRFARLHPIEYAAARARHAERVAERLKRERTEATR